MSDLYDRIDRHAPIICQDVGDGFVAIPEDDLKELYLLAHSAVHSKEAPATVNVVEHHRDLPGESALDEDNLFSTLTVFNAQSQNDEIMRMNALALAIQAGQGDSAVETAKSYLSFIKQG